MGELTRVDPIEPMKDSIATRAGAGPAGSRHVRRAIGDSPTRGLSFPLAGVARDPASSRPGGPSATTGEDVLLRLALWLAEVAAETTLAATAPAAAAARRTGRADESPIAEPAP
jgi:hypothetical protein